MAPKQSTAAPVTSPRAGLRNSPKTASASSSAAASTGNTANTSVSQATPAKTVEKKAIKKPSPLVASAITPVDAFLIDLYADLNRVCTGEDQPDVWEIRDFVRKGIVLTTFDVLDEDERARYTNALMNMDTDTQLAYNTAQSVLHDLARENDALNSRISTFTARLGFLLWSVCLHASSFREVLENTDFQIWDAYAQQIAEERAGSLELFARTRGLAWQEPIMFCNSRLLPLNVYIGSTLLYNDAPAQVGLLQCSKDDIYIRHKLSKGRLHPHEWILANKKIGTPATRAVLKHKGQGDDLITVNQVNVAESELILKNGHQNIWPRMTKWPMADPRYADYLDGRACELCKDDDELEYGSRCGHTRAGFLQSENIQPDAQVELVKYADKGTGVRALCAFKTGDVIGEYVGEVYPDTRVQGSTAPNFGARYKGLQGMCYRLGQDLNARSVRGNMSKSRFDKNEYASLIVDPAVKGNWTRFMNHSCRSHTDFIMRNVNQVQRIFVEAVRDIRFGDEITVNYRAGYFRASNAVCQCCEDCCVLWRTQQPPNSMTLGEARRNGQAPDWAKQRLRIKKRRRAR